MMPEQKGRRLVAPAWALLVASAAGWLVGGAITLLPPPPPSIPAPTLVYIVLFGGAAGLAIVATASVRSVAE